MADAPLAVLAIDGGNSKTDVALIAADGAVLATVRGPGASHEEHGVEQATRILDGLVRSAAAQAGRRSGIIAGHTSACLSGADLPEEEAQLTAALRLQGWSRTAVVVNDTFAVLRAGLSAADASGDGDEAGAGGRWPGGADRPWGVAVTCGAGINCVAVTPDGRIARYLARGTLTGDWGGGRGLGEQVMWHAMRAEDGRGPATALAPAVAAHFGLPSVADVAISVVKGQLGDDDLADLTFVLFAAAVGGDEVARELVERQAEEICAMAVAAMRRLGLPPAGVPVVLGGGLLQTRHTLLTSAVTGRLATAAPGAVPRVVDIPPVAGAALLGLDYLGAGAAEARRLRQCYLAFGLLTASGAGRIRTGGGCCLGAAGVAMRVLLRRAADNQVSTVLSPYLPGSADYGTPAETDYTYDADGRMTSVSVPPSGSSTTRGMTSYDYFDNGWTQDSTDPTGMTTSYDYNSLGEQSSRVIASPTGDLSRTMTWGYYPDGNLASLSDQGVPSAATSAQYTVNYDGGTATATVDQTQNNNNGRVQLGKWSFTQAGQDQQVSLAENSGGTVVADAVKIVRDTGETCPTFQASRLA